MRQSWKTCVSKLQHLKLWCRGHRAPPAPTGEHETTSLSITVSTETLSAPSEEAHEELRDVATAHLEDRSVDLPLYTGPASQTLSCSATFEKEQEEMVHATNADSERRWVDVFFYTGQASQTLTLQLATSLDNDDHEYSSETGSDDSFGSIIVGGIFAAPDTFSWADDVEEAFQAARPVTALGVYEPVDYE
jgi:hypothetical protein